MSRMPHRTVPHIRTVARSCFADGPQMIKFICKRCGPTDNRPATVRTQIRKKKKKKHEKYVTRKLVTRNLATAIDSDTKSKYARGGRNCLDWEQRKYFDCHPRVHTFTRHPTWPTKPLDSHEGRPKETDLDQSLVTSIGPGQFL